MTPAALTMMLIAWAIIGTFTIRFFWMVLKKPMEEDHTQE